MVHQSKYDEKDYFIGQNIYIKVPYDKENGQDGLVTTSRDIEALKIINDNPIIGGTEWLIIGTKDASFVLLEDADFNLLVFPSFAEAKDYLGSGRHIGFMIVDLLTADHHMQAGVLSDISAKLLKEYEDGRKG